MIPRKKKRLALLRPCEYGNESHPGRGDMEFRYMTFGMGYSPYQLDGKAYGTAYVSFISLAPVCLYSATPADSISPRLPKSVGGLNVNVSVDIYVPENCHQYRERLGFCRGKFFSNRCLGMRSLGGICLGRRC